MRDPNPPETIPCNFILKHFRCVQTRDKHTFLLMYYNSYYYYYYYYQAYQDMTIFYSKLIRWFGCVKRQKLTVISIVTISIVLVVLKFERANFYFNEYLSVASRSLLYGDRCRSNSIQQKHFKIDRKQKYIPSSSNRLFLPFFRKRLLTANICKSQTTRNKREITLFNPTYQCIRKTKCSTITTTTILLPLHSFGNV